MKKRINIKVIPNSKINSITRGNPLIIKVKEKAEKNKANISVINLLSKHFNSKVKIIRGFKSKKKVVEVELG